MTPPTGTVRIRIGDLPGMPPFLDAVAALLRALADCEHLPESVMAAADEVGQAVVGLGGRDVGPPP